MGKGIFCLVVAGLIKPKSLRIYDIEGKNHLPPSWKLASSEMGKGIFCLVVACFIKPDAGILRTCFLTNVPLRNGASHTPIPWAMMGLTNQVVLTLSRNP